MTSARTLAGAAVALSVSLLFGCHGSKEAATSDAAGSGAQQRTAGSTLAGDQLTRIFQMHNGYVMLITARDAIVSGDVDAARGQMTEIAIQPMPEGVSAIWAPEVLGLHTAAGEAARGEEPEGVAVGIGRAAAQCGTCHTATGHMPAIAEMANPPSPTDPSSIMLRHAWAAQQLWDGLIVPSERRWNEGVSVLQASQLEPNTLFRSEYYADAGAPRVHALQEASRGVAAASTWDERGEAFGELLSTCASCHGSN